MTQVTRHTIDVGPVQLSYLASGPAHGEPVVCLHGIPAGAELWRDVLPRLGDAGYRAYAPDLPGYGSTRVPGNGDRSLAGAAELLARWLVERRIGPVWVVGHDLGGAVAQILAVRHGEVVGRLSLSNSVYRDNWPVPVIARTRALARLGLYPPAAAAGLVVNPYTNWELARAFADPSRLTREDRDRVFCDGKVRDPRGRTEFAGHLASLDSAQTVAVADGLAGVGVPVLLIWGVQDPHQPWAPNGEALRDAFDRGRDAGGYADVVLLDDAGHFGPLECPEAFVDALLAWREV